jgi:WXG100 family type VII secretion target
MQPDQGMYGLTPEMLRTANDAEAIAESVETYVHALQAKVAEQWTHWQGTAPEAFRVKHEEWWFASNRFINLLEQLAVAARTSGVAYDAANEENTAMMNSLNNDANAI